MKKVLSTVAALGLIAGFAATASATDVPQVSPATGKETPAKPTAKGVSLFSVTGSYSVAGAYLSDSTSPGIGTAGRVAVTTNNLPTASMSSTSDAFYFHSFIMKPVLKVNDNIQVKADIRLADRHIWGLEDTQFSTVATSGIGPSFGRAGGRTVDANKIWMEYMSPIGKWSIGRMPSGAWYHPFMNSGARADRIIFDPNMLPEPFFMKLLIEKTNEQDVASGALNVNASATGSTATGMIRNNTNDQDRDLYLIHVGYKADMGTSVLGYFYGRNANAGAYGGTVTTTGGIPLTLLGALASPTAAQQDVRHTHTIKFYGNYNIAGFKIETEISHGMGEAIVNTGTADRDIDNWAAFVEVGTTLGATNVGAFYFFMSGDNNTADTEYSAALGGGGVGNDFNPFLILTGDWMGMLNADKGGVNGALLAANGMSAGVHGVGLKGSMAINDKLSLSGTVGSAWADEVNIGVTSGQNDDFGWEVDLGASYKLLDNLTYGVHFAYLNTGDFWLQGNATVAGTETNNVYFLAHQLVMKF